MKNNIVSFLRGGMALRHAVLFAAAALLAWNVIYFFCVGAIHGKWLDVMIIDSYQKQRDNRWFYYEAISTTSALLGWAVVFLGLWRCSENTENKSSVFLTKSFVIIFSLLLLLLWAAVIISLLFLGPAAL